MSRRTTWTLALLALLPLVLALRWYSFLPSVMDWDESLYILQAREWARGNWPLSGVWDMHPVGAPALVLLAFTLLGESIAAVRLLGAASVLATCYALVVLVRVAGGPVALAYAAALFYAGHTLLLGGLTTNTEILFAPMVVATLALAIWTGGPPWGRLLGMGVLIGLALVIKPVVTPEGCLAFALLAWPVLVARRWGRLFAMAGAYLLLCLAPTLLVAGIYALRGEFDIWLESSILAPFQYVSAGAPGEVQAHRITVHLLELRWLLLLPLAALLLWRRLDAVSQRLMRLGLGWLAVGALAVSAPGFFFDHYFLILLPPLSVMSAIGVLAVARFVAPGRVPLVMGVLVAAVASAPFLVHLQMHLAPGFHLNLPDVSTRVARAIRAEMRPGDVVFVANAQPVIYFLTGSPLPTRFPFPAHLTGGFGNLAGVNMDAEVARVLETRPRFIVRSVAYWGGVRPAASALIEAALAAHYTPMASFRGEVGPVVIHRLREPG